MCASFRVFPKVSYGLQYAPEGGLFLKRKVKSEKQERKSFRDEGKSLRKKKGNFK